MWYYCDIAGLKELLEDGLIQKEDFNEYPKRTEYSLTELGKELTNVFGELKKFGELL